MDLSKALNRQVHNGSVQENELWYLFFCLTLVRT